MSDLPKNETILLISGVQRLMHNPTIIEGETSSTGKTVAVEEEFSNKTYRLDTEKLLNGGTEFRDGGYYKLYTKEEMRSSQNANLAPGPVEGANEVSDADDLPEPTHSVR